MASTLVLVCLFFSALICIALSMSMDATIRNSGRITLIGLDASGEVIDSTNGGFSIDLGKISIGSSRRVSFTLRSISNVPTTLAIYVDDWEPKSLESFMRVSWNYSGTQIAPNEEISLGIDFGTIISSDFINYIMENQGISFSFSMNIYAVESGPL